VCGLVVKLCNLPPIEANHAWWESTRPTILKIHTDHRKNCIKAIGYNCVCFLTDCLTQVPLVGHRVLANLVPNRPGDDAYHKSLHGTFNVPYLLQLRENMVHYVCTRFCLQARVEQWKQHAGLL
jgi:hypothetical protein